MNALGMSALCHKRTFVNALSMSALCHKRTLAIGPAGEARHDGSPRVIAAAGKCEGTVLRRRHAGEESLNAGIQPIAL